MTTLDFITIVLVLNFNDNKKTFILNYFVFKVIRNISRVLES